MGFSELFFRFIMLVALFAVFLTLHIVQNHKLEDVNRRILKVQQGIKDLEVIKKKVDEFNAKSNELNRRIEIINILEKNRPGPLYVMHALAGAIPNRA